MIHDAHKRIKPDFPLADLLVAVLMRTKDIHRVIEMNRLEPFKPDDSVELREYSVKVVHYVVAAVPDMAGVEADANKGLRV